MATQTAFDDLLVTVTASGGVRTQSATDDVLVVVTAAGTMSAFDDLFVTVSAPNHASYRNNGAGGWDKVTRWVLDETRTWQLVAGTPPAGFNNNTPAITGGYPGPYPGPYPPPAGGPQPV